MAQKVVKLKTDDAATALRTILSEDEFTDFQTQCEHPATIGHLVLNDAAEVIAAAGVDEDNAAPLANVFDICEALTADVGQKEFVSTVFEARDMEITCRRLSAARLIVFRAKGNRKIGA